MVARFNGAMVDVAVDVGAEVTSKLVPEYELP